MIGSIQPIVRVKYERNEVNTCLPEKDREYMTNWMTPEEFSDYMHCRNRGEYDFDGGEYLHHLERIFAAWETER